MNMFPSIYLETPKTVCWNPQKRVHFSKTIDLRSHAYVYSQNECFPIYLLGNPKNVCWNRASEGVTGFTHQNEFSHLFSWQPCVLKSSDPRWLIWGVTCLGLLLRWMLCYLSPWKPHKWVLKPSDHGSFLQDNFEGSMPRFTLWMNVLPLSPWKCQKCVLKPSEQGFIYPRQWFEGSHAFQLF